MKFKNSNPLAGFVALLKNVMGLRIIMALLMLLALTVSSQAQGFQSRSFLGDGITNLLVVNGAWPAGTVINIPTNSYAGYTNATLTIQTGTNIFGTNANFMKGGIGYSNASPFVDVPLWANRDGTVPTTSISVHVKGYHAMFTNALVFHFAAIPRGNRAPATTAAYNLFQFQVNANGTSDVVIATNPPTAFLQGVGAIRLLDVTPATGGTNGVLVSCALNGFVPTP